MDAVEQVKEMIRELIANEDRYAPLTDDQIRIALEQREVVMSTDTVKKFRERLGLPTAVKRKLPRGAT